MEQQSFMKMRPRSVMVPAIFMQVSFNNTKKEQVVRVLLKDEKDIDKAKNLFLERYKKYDLEKVNNIALGITYMGSPVIKLGYIDLSDEVEIDNTFLAIKLQYEDIVNQE